MYAPVMPKNGATKVNLDQVELRSMLKHLLGELKHMQNFFIRRNWKFMAFLLSIPVMQLEDNFDRYINGTVDEDCPEEGSREGCHNESSVLTKEKS